jgi:hypothetical protein
MADRLDAAIDTLDRLVSRYGGETEREALDLLAQWVELPFPRKEEE